MPGMNTGLDVNDPVVVAAFRAALIHQGILALVIFGLVSAVWATARGRLGPSRGTPGRAAGQAAAWAAEPAGRRLLRLGFGLLWIFDGMLQAQPAMAVGLPSQVIGPEAASSPGWVQHVVNWGGTTWSYHPVQAAAAVGGGWRDRFRPAVLRRAIGAASARSVVSAGAVGVILLGVAPMAAAQANRTADPILAESIAGPSGPLNYPAPPFRLTGQRGRPVSLASLRGKAVLLTFLDPACTTGCPVAQEFRDAGQLLGASSRDVALVAITLGSSYRSAAVIGSFTRREQLDTVANWLFLTGSSPQLQRVWRAYSVTAFGLSAGAAAGHTSQVYVIDRAGRVRQVLNTDSGPGTAATRASFASLLAGAARQALRSP
jgi:cytochrome oxidase Cu insertion factor (SCO1/SenC/PrrC family)